MNLRGGEGPPTLRLLRVLDFILIPDADFPIFSMDCCLGGYSVPIFAALAAQALVQVFTKPWPWLIIVGWFAASNFDFGVFAAEARDQIFRLWWLVVAIIILLIVRQYLVFLSERERGKGRRE